MKSKIILAALCCLFILSGCEERNLGYDMKFIMANESDYYVSALYAYNYNSYDEAQDASDKYVSPHKTYYDSPAIHVPFGTRNEYIEVSFYKAANFSVYDSSVKKIMVPYSPVSGTFIITVSNSSASIKEFNY